MIPAKRMQAGLPDFVPPLPPPISSLHLSRSAEECKAAKPAW
jgi:hypothetical protein